MVVGRLGLDHLEVGVLHWDFYDPLEVLVAALFWDLLEFLVLLSELVFD